MPVILETTAGTGQLIAAAIIGFAIIIALITKFKLHPFLSLTIGALAVGAIAQLSLEEILESYSTGVGSTVASVGVLIALGAIIGKLLADSGGADEIVDTLVSKASPATLPWAMALIGAVIGLPMFFEIGLVLLVPVILLVTRRSKLPLMRVAIPALAGLSTMHALVPPHPGPLAAIGLLKADLGVTLGLGVLIAIPTIIVAGPLFSRLAARWVPVDAPDLFLNSDENGRSGIAPSHPKFSVTLMTVLLPVILMMGKALADIFAAKGTVIRNALDFLGQPMFALLLTTLLAIFTLGKTSGMDKEAISDCIGASLPPDRWHPSHRRCRRRFQADPRRHRHRQAAGRWHHRILRLPAADGLVGGCRHSVGDWVSNSRDGHRRGHPGARGCHVAAHPGRPAGARHWLWFGLLLPRQ